MTRIPRIAAASLALLAAAPAFGTTYSTGSWSTAADEGWKEVFTIAINDYSGTGNGDLSACIPGSQAFRDRMYNAGWNNTRFYTDDDAWSTDWESAGSDNSYADAADFGYVSAHGSSGAFYLNGNAGDNVVQASETRWGDSDLEVVSLDTCQTVDSAGRTAFISANLNRGVHFINGFQTNALDITTTADKYGYYLAQGYTVRAAWVQATKDGHGSDRTAAYVRFYNSSCDTYDDKLSSLACDPVSSSGYATATWSL